MERDPGFGHPFSAAIGAEVVVVIAIFVAAAIIVRIGGIALM